MSVGLGCNQASLTETTNSQADLTKFEVTSPAVLGSVPLEETVVVETVPEEPVINTAATANSPAVRVSAPELPPPPPPTLMQLELDATYNSRQCVIDHESRKAGMYTAEYGGSPSGSDGSTGSGAYQWLNSSWRVYLPAAEAFYGLTLPSPEEADHGARLHAAYASPYAQDLVTAFAFLHRDLMQNQKPWTYSYCWEITGTPKLLRADGPENQPSLYIQSQIG